MWMTGHQVLLLVFIFTINLFYAGRFADAFDRNAPVPPTKLSSIDLDAMSGDPERICMAIDAYKNYDNYMKDPELQWRLIRAYANYHSELAEQDLDKQKWAAETGYKFAVEIDAAHSDKAENVYYYASICIRYLYFHRIKALFLGSGLLRSFEKARRLNPDIDAAGPDRNLGVLYLKLPWPLGDKKKALQYLKMAVKIAPQRAANRLSLAKAFAELGLYQDGWHHIEFIRAGKFDVSSQHWHTIYMRRVEELAKEFPQNKNSASTQMPK
jgi:hypothetical protein